ncbi:hypothetical protein RhiJN_11183 [Ceratobasidium sp. AG-Ba]|nr:hypothetical protein RhiJN_11183 [Ceratobasidium sp. AG-Ba]QRW11890.1 hypothetical protein RhiLY_10889 [Ceratobasidium sp. AG-Ba]
MLVTINPAPLDSPLLPSYLPKELVLKVYDRRFAIGLREEYYLQPRTYDTEGLYRQYVDSRRAPKDYFAVRDEIDTFGHPTACPPELLEHLVTTKIDPYFASECAAYRCLQILQGRDIPKFYGSVQFLDGADVLGLNLSVPGILLEPIVGVSLDIINPASFDIQQVIGNVLHIVDTCGDLGLVNYDVQLGNFIVKADGSVVMIDFAQSRLRKPDESDLEWKRTKWRQDEWGCVGCAAHRKFGLPYVRSFKYLPPSDDEN